MEDFLSRYSETSETQSVSLIQNLKMSENIKEEEPHCYDSAFIYFIKVGTPLALYMSVINFHFKMKAR
jgi:hypothetical protein